MSTGERLETERLVLERLRPEDAREQLRLLLDPRVSATLWPRAQSPTEADVLDGLAAKIGHWDRHGFGMWTARDRETGELVGRGGLQYTYTAGLNDVEAGWAIVPERWGQGLATELAHACVEVACTATTDPPRRGLVEKRHACRRFSAGLGPPGALLP
jgi:ribosomal-protein-alanine N-acetyltransferase